MSLTVVDVTTKSVQVSVLYLASSVVIRQKEEINSDP